MGEFELILKNRLTDVNRRIDFVRCELDHCAPGTLTKSNKEGRIYYVHCYNEKGRRVRRGITNQPEVIESLLRRRVLENELLYLLEEKECIRNCTSRLREYDLGKEAHALHAEYPELDASFISDAVTSKSNLEWQNAPYEQSDYKPENKRHITTYGLRVRSKSELIIAEKLYYHRIAFHYEQVLHIDNFSLVPDFYIRRADGKLFVWEHMGMMENTEYRLHQKKKIEMYESMGFVPWDNLIVTYDTPDGLIDLRVIESEIQNKLL